MKAQNQYISKKQLSILALLLLIFLLAPLKSEAASLSLGVYPPLTKIRTAPNTHVQQNITLSNYSSDPINISISFRMFKSSAGNNGQITFLPNNTAVKNFFSERIKVLDGSIPVNQVLLSPQQNKSLTIDITIPKDARDTDYYISALFISNNTTQIKSNASLVSGGIASNILLSVLHQPSIEAGYIKEFSGPSLIESETVPFVVVASNQSTHYESVKGKITINNLLLHTKEIIPLHDATILANSSRYMTKNADESLSQVLWKHGFLFGVYQADAELYFGRNNKAFHKIIYFSSYPIVGFAIALIVIIFSGILALRISKNRA